MAAWAGFWFGATRISSAQLRSAEILLVAREREGATARRAGHLSQVIGGVVRRRLTGNLPPRLVPVLFTAESPASLSFFTALTSLESKSLL